MLTLSSGHSASYLTDAVATGRENYYTGAVSAGEPPGRWYGRGAAALGLYGEVDHQDMRALYERFLDPRDPSFRNPEHWAEAPTLGHPGRRYVTEDELFNAALDAEPNATSERQAEMRVEAGKRARKNVAFVDATFSVQKSITVLHAAFEAQEIAARSNGDVLAEAAWAAHRVAVEDAVWAGNRAALDYLAQHAGYSRVGHHGGVAGRFIDAHDFVVASFFQHDSRDHDPQLHIHNAILNRVEGSDGEWRTLDSRALHRYRGAAAAVAERTTEAHLSTTLGVRFATRPDGKAREVRGVRTEVVELFSSRRRAITAKASELVRAFETRFGRVPNSLELDRLQRQATFATRKSKTAQGEATDVRLERWDRELRAEVAGGLAAVARDVLELARPTAEPTSWSVHAVLQTALADIQASKSAWTAPDLTRAVSDALPDQLGEMSGEQVAALLDDLTARGLTLALALDPERPGDSSAPAELRLRDGRSVYSAPGGGLYATPEHVHTERLLVESALFPSVPALAAATADRFISSLTETGIALGADQAAAVRGVLTSGVQIETLIGPAGTGKSFVVGMIARAWADRDLRSTPGRVVGLATSQIATDVLAGEGLAALNIARWLATQQRLSSCDEAGMNADLRDEQWRLSANDLVVVDESAMADTSVLALVHDHVRRARAKVLLVGDHRQLAAVGAGGALDLVANAGRSYELTEARRFAQAWESAASLRLRVGDPEALYEYYKHGRLRDCGTTLEAERSAARAWLADTLGGLSAALVVDTNEQAARLNAELRTELVRLDRVTERGVLLESEGTVAGVGDLIQARANAWHLAGYEGNLRGPINRERLRVLAVADDGSLTAAPVNAHSGGPETLGSPMRLPAEYVAAHVVLGYAVTAHAAQGITVDAAHLVATPSTGPAAIYVGLSRGRHANTAHVTTLTSAADAPDNRAGALHRHPASALAVAFDFVQPERAALTVAAESADEAGSLRTAVELLIDAIEVASAGRTVAWLDDLVTSAALTPAQRTTLAAEDGAATLGRLLRRVELAGHEPFEALRSAVTLRGLGDARQLSNVLHHRIVSAIPLDPIGSGFSDWIPTVADPRWQSYLAELAATADSRARALGERATDEQPAWAVEALGRTPAEAGERARWLERAAVVAAHRELTGHDDPSVALGSAPRAGQPELCASWRAAWRALGREQSAREEVEMSDGQLRIRVRAWAREQVWAPRYVADELAATSEAAATHRDTATLRRAEAAATDDTEQRSRLEAEADQASALAKALDIGCAALREADRARGLWYAHTVETRAAAERADTELASRRARDDADERLVTAEQWLAECRAALVVEDSHRDVSAEADLTEVSEARELSLNEFDRAQPNATENRLPVEASGAGQGATLSAQEIADAVAKARAALGVLERRRVADLAREAEELRAVQLARWEASDHFSEVAADVVLFAGPPEGR